MVFWFLDMLVGRVQGKKSGGLVLGAFPSFKDLRITCLSARSHPLLAAWRRGLLASVKGSLLI